MKIIALFVVGLNLLVTCFGEECPKCPERDPSVECYSYSLVTPIGKPNCPCDLCINRCWDRMPKCPPGTYCVEELIKCPSGYECGPIISAVCKSPFTKCPPLDPSCKCPRTGHLKDQNGCESCLCEDPCKELNCPNDLCFTWSNQTGTENYYECAPPLGMRCTDSLSCHLRCHLCGVYGSALNLIEPGGLTRAQSALASMTQVRLAPFCEANCKYTNERKRDLHLYRCK